MRQLTLAVVWLTVTGTLASACGSAAPTRSSASAASPGAREICRAEINAAGTLSPQEKDRLRPSCLRLTGSTPAAVQESQALICSALAQDTLPRALRAGALQQCRRLAPSTEP